MSSGWEPLCRVGDVEAREVEGSGDIVVTFATSAGSSEGWWEYFNQYVTNLRLDAGFADPSSATGGGSIITLRCARDDFESSVEAVDDALEYANRQFEQNDLPEIERRSDEAAAAQRDKAARQSDLDARAEKMRRDAKPNRASSRDWLKPE